MLLIDSLYINNSGGLELLKYLVEYTNKYSIETDFLIDHRCREHFITIKDDRKFVIKASIKSRLNFYKKHSKKYKYIFCFGNIPPNLKVNANVSTYFHNINLLKIPPNSSNRNKIMSLLKQKYIKFYKNNTNRWIVQTNNTKDVLTKVLDEKSEKTLVIPFFQPINTKISVVDSTLRNDYIYISNYTKEKNHTNLIKAWFELYKLGYRLTLHLTLSSIPIELNRLIDEAKKRGIPIINHGFIPKSQVERLLLKSKVTIYPSLNESLGLGIIEALQYGCDVIGPNLPYIHTICKPSSTFDPFSIESIVESVIKYETNKLNRSELLIKNDIDQLFEVILKQYN